MYFVVISLKTQYVENCIFKHYYWTTFRYITNVRYLNRITPELRTAYRSAFRRASSAIQRVTSDLLIGSSCGIDCVRYKYVYKYTVYLAYTCNFTFIVELKCMFSYYLYKVCTGLYIFYVFVQKCNINVTFLHYSHKILIVESITCFCNLNVVRLLGMEWSQFDLISIYL